jgi:hypothetical protein
MGVDLGARCAANCAAERGRIVSHLLDDVAAFDFAQQLELFGGRPAVTIRKDSSIGRKMEVLTTGTPAAASSARGPGCAVGSADCSLLPRSRQL